MSSLPFLPVFLWTDILIYLLLAVIIVAVLYIRKQPHMTAPWKLVLQRKRGDITDDPTLLRCGWFIGFGSFSVGS